MKINTSLLPHQIQARLLELAAVFLFLYSLILTLSPAARERSWVVDYRWSHWPGFVIWAGLIALAISSFAAACRIATPTCCPWPPCSAAGAC